MTSWFTLFRYIPFVALLFVTSPLRADFEQEDLVCETTTTTGTGTVDLGGACTNYLTFLGGGVDTGDTVTYTIVDANGKIETGSGTFTDATPDTLSRTVLASSDGVATALTLSSGTHKVYLQWNTHSFNGGVGLYSIDSLTLDGEVFVGTSDPGADAFYGFDDTADQYEALSKAEAWAVLGYQSFCVAASDETTQLTTGTAKITWRTPYAFTLVDIKASVTENPTDATLIADVNEAGTSIMTTNKLQIETAEETTEDATTQPTLTDTSLAADAEMTIDIDQIGSTLAGEGLKVCLIGYPT